MKQKISILLFGLLLAVGWTDSAHAQLKRQIVPQKPIKVEAARPADLATSMDQPNRAPRRATITANVVHPRSWYENFSYSWSGGSADITQVAEGGEQIAALIGYIYQTPEIPGTLYSAAHEVDNPYPNIEFGWNIAPVGNSTTYSDIYVSCDYYFIDFKSITVYSGNTQLTSWSGRNNGSTLPSGWALYGNLGSNGDYTYFLHQDYTTSAEGGYFRIPASFINGRSNIRVVVEARLSADAAEDPDLMTDEYRFLRLFSVNNQEIEPSYETSYYYIPSYEFSISASSTGHVTPPTENGYTMLLVNVKDNVPFDRLDMFTHSHTDIVNYFDKYVKSVELLTDGLRVGEGTSNAGTVFSYTGVLDKFFFIGKGKMAYLSSLEGSNPADNAPFYSMYEEFSPDVESSHTNATDFYVEMTAGHYYPILHDCQSVIARQHFFSMAGKDTIDPKSVSSLVIYIPDARGSEPTWRNYVEGHQPQVGMYTIHLDATAVPSATYVQDSTYTVTLDWTSTLNTMTNNDVPQTYDIYIVNEETGEYEYLATVQDVTTYSYDVEQEQAGRQIRYVIKGTPTDATDPDYFFVYSNIDPVQIPGYFDFLVLNLKRYESDFVIHEERNYYRNYLYPSNLAPNTGMTAGQLKAQWPNQTASYILWRDETGVAKLEVMAKGDKVYYRIRYYEQTQDETGPNDIGLQIQYIND